MFQMSRGTDKKKTLINVKGKRRRLLGKSSGQAYQPHVNENVSPFFLRLLTLTLTASGPKVPFYFDRKLTLDA
jgi:hypothetical protein